MGLKKKKEQLEMVHNLWMIHYKQGMLLDGLLIVLIVFAIIILIPTCASYLHQGKRFGAIFNFALITLNTWNLSVTIKRIVKTVKEYKEERLLYEDTIEKIDRLLELEKDTGFEVEIEHLELMEKENEHGYEEIR